MPTHQTKIESIIRATFKGCSEIQFKNATQLISAVVKSDLEKAQKWDNLENKIAACYPESDEEEFDLCDIGEMAASAFGYL